MEECGLVVSSLNFKTFYIGERCDGIIKTITEYFNTETWYSNCK